MTSLRAHLASRHDRVWGVASVWTQLPCLWVRPLGTWSTVPYWTPCPLLCHIPATQTLTSAVQECIENLVFFFQNWLELILTVFCKHWRGQCSVFSEKLKKQSACYSGMDAAGSWHPFSWWSWPVTLGWLLLFLRSLWFCVDKFEIIWATKEFQQNELP